MNFKEIAELDKKLQEAIHRKDSHDAIDYAIKHLENIQISGEYTNKLEERRLLSLMARKWGRFIYEKTHKFHKMTISDYKEPIPKAPYKFIESFGQNDEEIFFGRDIELDEFLKHVKRSRLTLLYGKSGVGKTSFILAGLFPKLLYLKDYLPIYLRCSKNPLKSIKKAILINAEKEAGILKSKSQLYSLSENELNRLITELYKSINKELVIVIDQFEEFFTTLSDRTRNHFIAIFKNLLYDRNFDIKVVLSFRADFLAEFDEFSERIPDVFNNRFPLRALSNENARLAITKPLALSGFAMQDEVIEKIINELSVEGKIEPAQLQIVCFNLYHEIGESQKTITIEELVNQGGVKGILTGYLDYALQSVYPIDNREKAKEILKSMVSSKNTRKSLKESELREIKCRNEKINEEAFNSIISALLNNRLIVAKKDEENESIKSYEIMHECLIEKIKNWIDEESYELKKAEDMFRQEENNWENYRIVMELSKYEIINYLREKLFLDKTKLGLLLRTSIKYNKDIDYWVERNIDNPEALIFLENALEEEEEIEIHRNIIIAMLQIEKSLIARAEILKLLGGIVNRNVVEKISKVSKEFSRIDKETNIKIREIFENKILKNMAFINQGICILGFPANIIEELKAKGLYSPWFEKEYPEHPFLVEDFLIDMYLVTNEEYKDYDSAHTFPKGHERHPATNVSWHKARKYALSLGKDLPTEEEWEKAARGTDGRLFPWGNEFDSQKCNTKLSGISGTTPVDRYPIGTSPYGCYDMAGNVWEWTSSWREKEKTAIIRGGSWSKQGILPWCAYKYDYDINEGMQNVGFRCIRRIRNNSKDSSIGYYHVEYSAGGLVFKQVNGKRMVLLGRHEESMEWKLPKGTLNNNESVEECAIREVKEETGYNPKIIEFINFVNWSYYGKKEFFNEIAFFYIMELENEMQYEQDVDGDNEFDRVEWMEVEDAIKILTYPAEKKNSRGGNGEIQKDQKK